MKKIMMTVSHAALIALAVSPLLFYAGKISLDETKTVLSIATAVWFVSALFWMGHESGKAQDS